MGALLETKPVVVGAKPTAINSRIYEIEKDMNSTRARLTQTKKRLRVLYVTEEKLHTARWNAFATGKDTRPIKERLRGVKEEIDHLNREAVELISRLLELGDAKACLVAQREIEATAIPIALAGRGTRRNNLGAHGRLWRWLEARFRGVLIPETDHAMSNRRD